MGRIWKWVLLEADHQKHEKFSLVYEKNFMITMIALVFVILKHSLQWRGEIHLYFGPVPEFLLVNSAARRFSMAASFEGKFLSSFFYWCNLLTIFGSAGIWPDNLCPASQWKCWKSNIRSSVFNNINIHIYIHHKIELIKKTTFSVTLSFMLSRSSDRF